MHSTLENLVDVHGLAAVLAALSAIAALKSRSKKPDSASRWFLAGTVLNDAIGKVEELNLPTVLRL